MTNGVVKGTRRRDRAPVAIEANDDGELYLAGYRNVDGVDLLRVQQADTGGRDAFNRMRAHPTTLLTDSLSVVVTTIPDAASDVYAALNWRELR